MQPRVRLDEGDHPLGDPAINRPWAHGEQRGELAFADKFHDSPWLLSYGLGDSLCVMLCPSNSNLGLDGIGDVALLVRHVM